MTASAVPSLDVNPFTEENLTAPREWESQLRKAGPVAYLPHLDAYAIGRFEDVRQVLADWQHFESGPGVGLSNFRRIRPWRAKSIVLEADPPWHDAPRRVLEEVLGTDAIRTVRERWRVLAEQLVEHVLAEQSEDGIDVFQEIALAFPLRVIPDAIGIGDAGRENLVPFSDFLLNAFGPRNALVIRDQHTGSELSAWVDAQCQREALRPGSWGAAVWAASDRGDITPDQAPLVLRSLFAAGVNSTVQGLAALLLGLATHPTQWALVRENPRMRAAAFEEAVRWYCPIQSVFRTTRGTCHVGGVALPDNVKVMVCVGAANHDETRWPNPYRFDVTRGSTGHLGFGHGIHGCLGQQLARLEAVSLLDALAPRVTRMRLTRPPEKRLNNTLHALRSLHVSFSGSPSRTRIEGQRT